MFDPIRFDPIRILAVLCLMSGTILPAQAAGGNELPHGTVNGTVTYRQRIALPADAVVTLTIKDLATGEELAQEHLPTQGHQVPISFDVSYDPGKINPSHRYQIHATITSGGTVLFASTAPYFVLTQDAPQNLEILVQQVPAKQPQNSGAKGVPLIGTQWNLIEVAGRDVTHMQGAQRAYVELREDGHRVSGSGGCNRLMGSYDAHGRSLHFEGLATTMMACPSPSVGGSGSDAGERWTVTDQERSFLDALGKTSSFEIHASTLELLDGDGKVVARLHAAMHS